VSSLNEGQNASQPSSDKPGGNRQATLIRQGVLIGILVIVGGALAYDYLVARPKAQAAYDKAGEFEKSQAVRDVVIKELGEPSKTFTKEGDLTIDRYDFRSGVIFRKYEVYIVYNRSGIIESSAKDQEPQEMSLADVDPSDSEDPPSDSPSPPGYQVNAGNGADPAQFVARIMENDADGDGMLSGDEIPERIRSNLEQVDTNSDGALDRDELTAMAESFGSDNGSSDGGNRPSRPETDE
jgi:hypothetical protein